MSFYTALSVYGAFVRDDTLLSGHKYVVQTMVSLNLTWLWHLTPHLFSFRFITPHLASANLTSVIQLQTTPAALVFYNPTPPLHSWSLFQALNICLLCHCLCSVPPLPSAPIHFSWPCWQRGSSQVLSFSLLRILQAGPLTFRIRSELLIQANKTFLIWTQPASASPGQANLLFSSPQDSPVQLTSLTLWKPSGPGF